MENCHFPLTWSCCRDGPLVVGLSGMLYTMDNSLVTSYASPFWTNTSWCWRPNTFHLSEQFWNLFYQYCSLIKLRKLNFYFLFYKSFLQERLKAGRRSIAEKQYRTVQHTMAKLGQICHLKLFSWAVSKTQTPQIKNDTVCSLNTACIYYRGLW